MKQFPQRHYDFITRARSRLDALLNSVVCGETARRRASAVAQQIQATVCPPPPAVNAVC
jgi:hypothetical protein